MCIKTILVYMSQYSRVLVTICQYCSNYWIGTKSQKTLSEPPVSSFNDEHMHHSASISQANRCVLWFTMIYAPLWFCFSTSECYIWVNLFCLDKLSFCKSWNWYSVLFYYRLLIQHGDLLPNVLVIVFGFHVVLVEFQRNGVVSYRIL